MKQFAALLITLALIAGMVGCPAAPLQVELEILSTSGGSVITPGEATFIYDAGTVVELVAEAEEGYRFVDWTGDEVVSPASATTTITMDAAKSVTANFAQARYSLTVECTDGGSVVAPGEGTFTYDCGSLVPLVVEAENGYRFASWTGDVSAIADSSAASTTITMNDNYSITAVFIAQYVLTIDSTGGGEVVTPGEGTFTYDSGTVVSLVAEPGEGYKFASWTGDVADVADVSAASTAITMAGDCSIAAVFEEDEVVTFVDIYLEAAIRQAIAKPEGPIYAWDMEQLTELVADWIPISDLSGLEYATRLTRIHLEVNQISDISPLAGLTNLTQLSVTNCPLSDISPVANLTNLTWINFQGSQISDISPVANLINLTGLWLGSNRISDISPLTNLTNLDSLYLWHNEIGDLSPLAGLTSLTTLYVPIDSMSDLSLLRYLSRLTSLGLSIRQISDAELPDLGNLTNLTGLSIENNQVSDISPLANLTSLTWLRLNDNQISDISPVAGLTNLWYLNLGNNQISDVTPLASISNLSWLSLCGNTDITDITPLTDLTRLRILGVCHSQVSDITPLGNLTRLTALNLAANQIRDISPLANLIGLRRLNLASNQIIDISPLVQNEGLCMGNQIDLQWNPLSSYSINICIPELEARGVIVYY